MFIGSIQSKLTNWSQQILCITYSQAIIFMSIYTAPVPTYRNYTFPLWSIILGWCLAFSSVVAVPIVAFWYFFCSKDKDRKPSRSGGTASGSSSRHGKRTPNHHRSVSISCSGRSHGKGQTTITTTVLTNRFDSHQQNRMNEEVL